MSKYLEEFTKSIEFVSLYPKDGLILIEDAVKKVQRLDLLLFLIL